MARREFSTRTVLIVVIGFAALAVVALKGELDKRKLSDGYAKAQATVRQLEDDWVRLNQELSDARQTVDTQAGDLSQLRAQFDELSARLAQTEQEVVRLRQEYATLEADNTELVDQLAITNQQRDALQAKLSSVKELRVALRELKGKIWKQRWQAWVDALRMPSREDAGQLAQGNRGYVVRNGTSTLSSGTRLQVRVLDPETQ